MRLFPAVLFLTFVVALFTVAGVAQVQAPKPKKHHAEAAIIMNGNALYDLCQHYKTEKLKGGELSVGCFMYISGATQTLVLNDDTKLMKSPCPGKGVTDEQIADVVIKWMEDHPEKRDLPGPYIIAISLEQAFPCE